MSKDYNLCNYYNKCASATICLRCMVPKNGELSPKPPYCFKEAKGDNSDE